MIKTFKYRLYPTREQEVMLDHILAMTRQLYNAALEHRILAYKKAKVSISRFEQQRQLTEVRAEMPEHAGIFRQYQTETLIRLEKAFKAFFARNKKGLGKGFPRFKGKTRWDSFTAPLAAAQKQGRIQGNKVFIPNADFVKVNFHRPLQGKPKYLTVKREGRKWYVIFTCADVIPVRLEPTGYIAGIDLGTVHFLTTSDGVHVENPRWFKAAQQKLRVAQRMVARRKKGSNRRRKAVEALQKIHLKIKNQRHHFQYSTAKMLVQDYDVIGHEDLKVQNMSRKARGTEEKPGKQVKQKAGLNKSILDAAWGSFISILNVKAEEAGRTVITVDPRYTSQTCSCCGHVSSGSRKSQSKFKCVACGHVMNADVNAAINIRARAVPSGVNGRELSHTVA